MASLLSKSSWLNSRPQSPKMVEETVGSEDEYSTESVMSYIYSEGSASSAQDRRSELEFSYFVTGEDPKVNETKLDPSLKSSVNLRSSILTYKIKSVIKIQNFFRLKRMKKKLQVSFEILSKSLDKNLRRKGLTSLKTWAELNKSAIKIQRIWKKNYKNCKDLRSQLVRLIKLGSKFKKVNNFIETIRSNLSLSSSCNFKSFRRSQTAFGIYLSTHDTLESNTHSPAISNFERSQLPSPKSEVLKFSSFSLLKPSAKLIRIKRKTTLDLKDLSKQLENDARKFECWKGKSDSIIPTLSKDCKFFQRVDSETKKYLLSEYSELLKQ